MPGPVASPGKTCGQVAWVSVRCDYGYTDRTGWAAKCNEKNAELTEPPSGSGSPCGVCPRLRIQVRARHRAADVAACALFISQQKSNTKPLPDLDKPTKRVVLRHYSQCIHRKVSRISPYRTALRLPQVPSGLGAFQRARNARSAPVARTPLLVLRAASSARPFCFC